MSPTRRPWRRLAPFLFLVGCAGLAAGCAADPMRVRAERATHDWFAPLMRDYITADALLDDAAKATHLRGLDAWDARIRAEEELLGVGVRQ